MGRLSIVNIAGTVVHRQSARKLLGCNRQPSILHFVREIEMAKTQRSSSSGKYVLTPAAGHKPATLRNRETGEVLVLHSYGASKGKFEVKKGIDLTKPIFEQVLKMETRKKRKASAKRRAHRKVPMGQLSVPVLCDSAMRARIESLTVELTPDAAQWVEAAVASGRFPTAEDAVRYAINHAKRAELRAMLDASEAEGGSYTTEEVRRHVREHLDRLKQPSSAS